MKKRNEERNEERNIGIVASGSKPASLKFYLQEQISDDYVMIEVQDERIIYEIVEVEAHNSRLDDIEFVRYILPDENYSQYNIFKANAKPIGKIKSNKVSGVGKWFIAPPGEIVRPVSKSDVALIYGVGQGELKQKIGRMLGHDQIPVWVNFPELLTTHMALVGRSGQGKSNMVKILLKNLPMNYVVFTKVNEYLDIESANTYDLKNGVLNWNIDAIRRIFELNNTEAQNLKECVNYHDFHGRIHTLELSHYIQKYYMMSNKYQQVSLFETEQDSIKNVPKYVETLCKKIESFSIEIDFDLDTLNTNQSYIFNMQAISDKEEEIMIFSFLFNLLSTRRKNYKETRQELSLDKRIVIFIEEAHNYIPSTKTTICKEVIRQVAREGRKLGIHLVLLSQRPRHLDPTALSQCGSIVSFNLTNPEDIDYLMANANFYGDYYRNQIRDLKIGECMIISDFMTKGIGCKIDLDKGNNK